MQISGNIALMPPILSQNQLCSSFLGYSRLHETSHRTQIVLKRSLIRLLFVISFLAMADVWSATCLVPEDRDTISAAVADPLCDIIQLGAATFPESLTFSRSVTLSGAGIDNTVINGLLTVSDASVVQLSDMEINGAVPNGSVCQSGTIEVLIGGLLQTSNVRVRPGVIGACDTIFSDGFE